LRRVTSPPPRLGAHIYYVGMFNQLIESWRVGTIGALNQSIPSWKARVHLVDCRPTDQGVLGHAIRTLSTEAHCAGPACVLEGYGSLRLGPPLGVVEDEPEQRVDPE
jgi:hypothetical protein